MENNSRNSAPGRSRLSKLTVISVPPLDSTLIRYLQSQSPAASPKIRGFGSPVPSRSPLTSIENFYTPPSRSPTAFKVEEDVVVMDGFPVGNVTRGKGRLSSSSISRGTGRSSLVTESVGSSSSASVSWQRDGSPRLKVGQAKEELHSSRFANKRKSEAKICTFTSSGSCSHGTKCPFIHHHTSESESPTYLTATATPKVPKLLPKKLEKRSKSCDSINSFTLKNSDWSPLDDGIDCSFPPNDSTDKTQTREAVKAYVDGLLYGPSLGNRLSAFAEVCRE